MKRKIIYCPECAREIYRYDGKHETEITKRCLCGRYVKYCPATDRTVIINRPERQTASGVRFW